MCHCHCHCQIPFHALGSSGLEGVEGGSQQDAAVELIQNKLAKCGPTRSSRGRSCKWPCGSDQPLNLSTIQRRLGTQTSGIVRPAANISKFWAIINCPEEKVAGTKVGAKAAAGSSFPSTLDRSCGDLAVPRRAKPTGIQFQPESKIKAVGRLMGPTEEVLVQSHRGGRQPYQVQHSGASIDMNRRSKQQQRYKKEDDGRLSKVAQDTSAGSSGGDWASIHGTNGGVIETIRLRSQCPIRSVVNDFECFPWQLASLRWRRDSVHGRTESHSWGPSKSLSLSTSAAAAQQKHQNYKKRTSQSLEKMEAQRVPWILLLPQANTWNVIPFLKRFQSRSRVLVGRSATCQDGNRQS